MVIFRREPPPPTGASNASGVGTNRDSEPIALASLRAVNTATGQVLSTWRRRTTVPQVVTCDTYRW